MTYAQGLRAAFPRLGPTVEDLYLLEAHQVAELPSRAEGRALAAVLHSRPDLVRLFVARHPPVAEPLFSMLSAYPAVPPDELRACEESVVWEVADWILYERAPEYYDETSHIPFDARAVAEVASLHDAVVVDAGAGTGRVTFAVAGAARHVFAVEPVAALRRFIREKAARQGLRNVYVVDGFLDQVPLPDSSADVLVTCNAIGWQIDRELAEVARVVRRGGTAVHLLFGTDAGDTPSGPVVSALEQAGYNHDTYRRNLDGCLHRYVTTVW
jgi:methylase of polypeptide subunit release factors